MTVDRSLVLRKTKGKKTDMMCHLMVPQVPEEGAQVQVKQKKMPKFKLKEQGCGVTPPSPEGLLL